MAATSPIDLKYVDHFEKLGYGESYWNVTAVRGQGRFQYLTLSMSADQTHGYGQKNLL